MPTKQRPLSAGGSRPSSTRSHGSPRERRLSSVAYASAWPTTFHEGVTVRAYSPDFRALLRRSPQLPNESSPLLLTPRDVGDCSSFWGATLNVINVLMGVGVLSLPYSMRVAGLTLGLGLLLGMGIIANLTGHLLGACLASDARLRSYPDIVNAAFGLWGRRVVSMICFVELFIACTMFLILVTDSLHMLFPAMAPSALLVIVCACILPSTWLLNLAVLSTASLLGVLSSLALLLLLLNVGLTTPPGELGSIYRDAPTRWVADDDAWALSIGLTLVGFAGHAVFPSIYSTMDDPAQYSSVLNVAYTVIGAVYAAVAVAGYVMYGDATEKEITLSLLTHNPGGAANAVMWMIALNPCTKFAIVLHPIALSLEELLAPLTHAVSPRTRYLQRCSVRTALALCIAITALLVPNFVQMTSLLGAVFAMAVVVVIPCACYLKLFYSMLHWSSVLGLLSLVAISCALGFVGALAAGRHPSTS
ncbi:hypothetical protein SDRG_02743 [Saprolegnia diclina VS20]|uniref:Amino acid transporter transmembrane domain-containing protein n=1 Tax=Saprolegnia diclina (strain VS20) TaxID=1156394 RepID=T0S4U1_SAPDV|nr:hypothetical protein SDRG_02743 [Saprolegnia diclina VS20]EQC40088.1 hypothetical protein SDRG_02743 [Saprolegnia diclina VS20]|eukprot:XP_008606562.1 hypothetical protein SDRG_02743 [Saprolegnia diclina VS20]